MAIETVLIDGQTIVTLRELLRPGLRAVFIGINPSPISVAAGHYYQGGLGLRVWQRFQDHHITGPLPKGREDETAFAEGLGFADVVRRPTGRAAGLSATEMADSVPSLLDRLQRQCGDRPVVVFVYAKAAEAATKALAREGYPTARMPGPFAPTEEVRAGMKALRAMLTAV